MQKLKKYFGVLWMLLGAYVAYYGVTNSWSKISSANLEDRVFGWVVLCVLVPIIVGGLILFGKYALDDEYNSLKSTNEKVNE
ncbi:MAG: hypothetical protein JWP57_302 [Spirosoma sp.]|nr:hypothetical protein [Spirosoma sp.]